MTQDQVHLNNFIAECTRINKSFNTQSSRFGRSSVHGLLEELERQIKTKSVHPFVNYYAAVAYCRNQASSRIDKYKLAIERLITVWGDRQIEQLSSETILGHLRNDPLNATSAYSFVVNEPADSHMALNILREHGGRCKLKCTGSIPAFTLEVKVGTRDWYIPYKFGKAAFIDVPFGEPDKTMVVTFPMNGCALVVHETGAGNRFYHDADGKCMPKDLTTKTLKFRADSSKMSGSQRSAEKKFNELTAEYLGRGQEGSWPQNFQHDLIAVMQGGVWHVYQTCTIITKNEGSVGYVLIKKKIPNVLGSFKDKALDLGGR